MGTTGEFYFCWFDIYDIVKNLSVLRLDSCHNISLISIRPNHDFDFSTVECFRILMICRFSVDFICGLNDFIQIRCHPHFVCIHLGAFPLQCFCILRPDKFFSAFFCVFNRPAVPLKTVRIPFFDGLLHYGFPIFLWNTVQDIFINFDVALSVGILLDRKTNIASFRRALILEGCGVFFCCPQGVHGLFGVGEVFVLQGPSLGLGQPLCLQGGGIAGVDGQHFLGPADDVAQQILHPVHHLVDGTPHARIFLGLSALEFHPALEVRFRRKDPPPRIGHQFLGGLLIGQLLAGVHVHLVPDHLVYALISVHLGKVGQGMVLQALCARLVEGVIPVVVLVQHGAENVADVVPEENTGRLVVHIGPDVRIVLQHVLQHSVGAGGGGVQLDDPAAHVGAVVIQRPFIVDPPLSARALVGQAAAVAARLFLGVCTVEVGGIQRDPPALAAVQNIIDVQGSIVHHTGQPQRVVEALHLVHLRQMVDR